MLETDGDVICWGNDDDGQSTVPSGAGPFGPPPPNTAPIAANDAYSTTEGTQLDVPGPGVLANDNDADGNSLTAVLVDDASNGGLTFNPDGSFTYSPDAGFTGHDTFTYKANDGTDDSPIATVTITVNAIATPIATCGGFDVFETAPGVFAAPSFPGNLIVGSNGHDWLIGTDGPDLILGLQGPDDIYGKDGDDVICGGAGVDIIEGQQGNDTLYGNPQDDWLIGGPDNDTLYGGKGWDDLEGNGGQDILYGNKGDDNLNGGDGNDFCKGGPGNDTIAKCEGASAASNAADDGELVDESAARRSNDGENGEHAIAKRIQQLFLPLVSND